MKIKTLILVIATLFNISLFGQAKPTVLKYIGLSNGLTDSSETLEIIYSDNVCYLSGKDANIQEFIDYKRRLVVDIMEFDKQKYKTIVGFDSLAKAIKTENVDKLMGYPTKKAVYRSFSNTIEVWYTTEGKVKGSPYKRYLPKDALVVKILINGSRGWQLTDISKNKKIEIPAYNFDIAKEITQPVAREMQIKSRYVNLPVFNRQQINWGDTINNPKTIETNRTYRFSGGTVIMKKVKLPRINKKNTLIFATITHWSNGDAYDRTGSLFTISGKKDKTILDACINGLNELPVFTDNKGGKYQGLISTKEYETPVELMRFFTSFGVSHFNNLREINGYNWQDSVVYKQEITKLIPLNEKEIWLGIFIGNYDKGGHYVSLDLQFYPAWEETKPAKKYVNSLFCTLNLLEMTGQNYGRFFGHDTLQTSFTIPEGIENLELLYTSTGHGGWGGGDEFNPKLNQVFIDGKLIFSIVPWRSDCGTYRMSNPASGNFKNGLSSSDLSRSNWCPGTVTSPYYIPLKDLSSGEHSIEVVIDQGVNEGNSFSAWNVSGVLVGEIEQ
jgi:hypothetical protein